MNRLSNNLCFILEKKPLTRSTEQHETENEIIEIKEIENEPELESEQSWRGKTRENSKQAQIRESFQHAWRGYKRYAWGHDMLKPISKSYEDWFTTKSDQMGLTVSFIFFDNFRFSKFLNTCNRFKGKITSNAQRKKNELNENRN